MKLKPVLDTLDGLDEAYHGFYEARADGKFVLQLDGDVPGLVPKDKLDEFRDNNRKLMKDLQDLQERYKDVDPEKYKEISARIAELEDKELLDAGKVEELLEQRTERMRKEFETQRDALVKTTEDWEAKYNTTRQALAAAVIDNQIASAVGEVGTIRKGALTDITARARAVWQLDDENNPVALDGEGNALFGADGKAKLTMTEWATDLARDASYLFESTNGGGGKGSGGGEGHRGGSKVINAGDEAAFMDNVEGIANGTVEVANG